MESRTITEPLQIKFGGDSHQVSVNTIINTLTNYQRIIDITNKELGEENYKIDLQIKALEKGSFVIDLLVYAQFIPNIFDKENLQYVANLVVVATGCYKLFKKLKGKKVKNEDIQQLNQSGNNTIINANTVNIYNKANTRQAISSTINAINNDKSITDLSLSNSNKELVKIERQEFEDLATAPIETIEEEITQRSVIDYRAILNIISVSFDSSYNWRFYYKDEKITIKINNTTIQQRIDEGEDFSKGDSLIVELEIHQVYNEIKKDYENKSYKIRKFIDFNKAGKQQEINF